MAVVTLGSIPVAADQSVAKTVSQGLDRVRSCVAGHLASATPEVQRLIEHTGRYHGKMFRPALTLLSGLAAGGPRADLRDEHVTVASVLEIIHLATLVHDDVLDDADARRGHASINAMSGNERSVILGDYLFARSYHLCSTLQDQHVSLRVGEVTSEVCEGEMLQLSRRGDTSLSEDTYFRIINGKTAALIAAAAELGASMSGADDAVRGALMRFGRNVGLAFQIRDDVLDLTADADEFGKPVGKDVEKGKMTLPLIHHLRTMPPDDRPSFESLVRIATPLNGKRASLLRELETTGSIAYADDVAHGLLEAATAELALLPASPAVEALRGIADAAVDRAR